MRMEMEKDYNVLANEAEYREAVLRRLDAIVILLERMAGISLTEIAKDLEAKDGNEEVEERAEEV